MELQNLFAAVCSMTVTGSMVILCVLLARQALKKAPRVFAWMLWLVVIFRLLCPVSVPGPVSVLEWADAPRTESGAMEFVEPPVQAPVETILAGPQQAAESVPLRAEPPMDWNLIGTRLWALGVGILLAYGVISYGSLKRKLRESVPLGKGIREADGIASPFVLGRTVYLPSDLKEEERAYILLHERLHIRHGDPVVKLLFWAAVCLHWFNPLVWLGFFLCGRDMELRCDEAVLKKLGPQVRSRYAQSLLDLAAGRHFAPAPLAFGEGDTGKRVKFVLNWKGSKAWMAVFGAVLCAVVLVLTGCDPAAAVESPFGHSYRVSAVIANEGQTQTMPELFTLASDAVLTVPQDGQSVMYGALKEVASGTPLPVTMPEGTHTLLHPIEHTWKTGDDGWWLFQKEDGELHLWREGEYLVKLERTDLLGVTIRQPGVESYVEPVWYQPGNEDWYLGRLGTSLVAGEAQIMLTTETGGDRILVSEEYYELLENGEYAITNSDHLLEPDEHGDFSLDVSRRGRVGDDFAIYRVTVGEEHYLFRLTFVTVPWETSVTAGLEERTREVIFNGGGASIVLRLPESWSYAITSVEEDEYNAGIDFWPMGREAGKLHFGYYPRRFGVCGTGLETATMTLGGQTAEVGTYDGRELWDYICFDEHFAVWGVGHESWWAEYGETAMEILEAARFGSQ